MWGGSAPSGWRPTFHIFYSVSDALKRFRRLVNNIASIRTHNIIKQGSYKIEIGVEAQARAHRVSGEAKLWNCLTVFARGSNVSTSGRCALTSVR
jgi:hypothetical protein